MINDEDIDSDFPNLWKAYNSIPRDERDKMRALNEKLKWENMFNKCTCHCKIPTNDPNNPRGFDFITLYLN